MKRKRMVYVRWHDAVSSSVGWTAKEELTTDLAICHSIGFVHSEDKEKITIIGSYGEEDVSQAITIPKSWIVEIKDLRVK